MIVWCELKYFELYKNVCNNMYFYVIIIQLLKPPQANLSTIYLDFPIKDPDEDKHWLVQFVTGVSERP